MRVVPAKLVLATLMSVSVALILGADPARAKKHNIFHLGVKYYTDGDHEKARHYLEHVVKLKPRYWPANYHLANTYLKLGELKKAKYQYSMCLENRPDIATCKACSRAINFLNLEIPRREAHLDAAQKLKDQRARQKKEYQEAIAKRDQERVNDLKKKRERILAEGRAQADSIRKAARMRIESMRTTTNIWVRNTATGEISVNLPTDLEDSIKAEAEGRAQRVMYLAEQRAKGIRIPTLVDGRSTVQYVRNYTRRVAHKHRKHKKKATGKRQIASRSPVEKTE